MRFPCVSFRVADSPRLYFAIAALILLVQFTACERGASDGSGGAEAFVQSDSAGVTLSITSGQVLNAHVGWVIDSLPELVIGAVGVPGDSGVPLFRVQGIRALSDGQVLVVNGGSRELQFYDSDGRLQRAMGGRGDGPGEFRDPVLVPWIGSDSLLLFDKESRRFQYFSSDGREHEVILHQSESPAGARAPLSAVGSLLLYARQRFVGGESSLQSDGLRQVRVEYFWYDPATAQEIGLESVVFDWTYNSGGLTSAIPFTSRPAAAATEAGVLITDGRTGEIREYDLKGTLRRILRLNAPARPVTRAMMRAALTQSATQAPGLPLPDALPFFRSLRIDASGWLWAQIYGWNASQPEQWVIFDANGQAHGTVVTPAGLEVQVIGDDFIMGIWRDEFGVEYVRRYSLSRTALEQSNIGTKGSSRTP